MVLLSLSWVACVPSPSRAPHRSLAHHQVVAPAPRAPSTCTLDRSPAFGGVLDRGFVEALRDDLAEPLEAAFCACAASYGLAAPSSLRVVTRLDPNRGRVESVRTDLDEGEGPAFDWPGFEGCLDRSMGVARLPKRALGTCAEPRGDGGRVILALRVRAR